MGQTCSLALRCFTGMLKKWSLVIYGTAEQPYHMHRQRPRSAEFSEDTDLTEAYNGDSYTLPTLVLDWSFLHNSFMQFLLTLLQHMIPLKQHFAERLLYLPLRYF